MIDSTTPNNTDSTQLQVQLARLEERVGNLGQKLDKLASDLISTFVTRAEMVALEGKVNDLRDNQKWIVRTILGAVLMGVIGVVYKLGGVPH